jgi:hypothetical protein
MRYAVGQKIWTVFFHNMDAVFYPMWSPYIPWQNKALPEIEFLQLTVVAHHKVHNEYDEKDAEPTCDGFILKDEQGRIWHNQYPRASYGQTTDSADGLFRMSTEHSRKEFNETLDFITTRREARVNGDDEIKKAPHVIETYDLMRELNNMNYGAHNLDKRVADPRTADEALPHYNKLNLWYGRVVDAFKERTGLKIDHRPLIYMDNKTRERNVLIGHVQHFAIDENAPEMFYVVKASRGFSGHGYSGPTLANAGYTLLEAKFEGLENARRCASALAALNPVGFDVYSSKTKEIV